MLNQLVDLINKNFQSAGAKIVKPEVGDSAIEIQASELYKVVEFIRDNNELPFNALQVISGVDYLDHIEVNYIFANFDPKAPRDLILKVRLTDRLNPELESIEKIYLAAPFQERECYDMFGVKFKNLSDHRRILCPDDWVGFPLRKDYMAPKFYNDMEVYPENKMNIEDREFIVRQKKISGEQTDVAVEE